MRKRIYEIIEPSKSTSLFSRLYDSIMIIVIIASLIPLAFRQESSIFVIIDRIAVSIFILDYILRLAAADFKYNKRKPSSFLRYPFSFLAMIDLLSILPSIALLNNSFRLLRVFRLIRAFRVFRVFKVLRYSKSFVMIVNVFRKQKAALLAVISLAVAYILISALVIYNVEPDSFDTFFTAVYWATVSLTTVGYGDIYPITDVGRIITMVSSIFGIAIIALPSGIITAGYLKEFSQINANLENKEEIL